jgi:hypothetical protein
VDALKPGAGFDLGNLLPGFGTCLTRLLTALGRWLRATPAVAGSRSGAKINKIRGNGVESWSGFGWVVGCRSGSSFSLFR